MFCGRCGTELDKKGFCPQCDYNKADKKIDRKKVGIIAGLALIAVVGVGVGVWFAADKPNGIRVSEESKYQNQVIDPEDIYVEYSGREDMGDFSGDTNSAVSNLSVSYDDWSVTPYDASGLSFYEQFCLMEDIYSCYFSSVNSGESVREILAEKANDQTGFAIAHANTDVYYTFTYREGSEWIERYSNSTISEVYHAYGLPDFGEEGILCYHGQIPNSNTDVYPIQDSSYNAFCEYFKLNDGYKYKNYVMEAYADIPLSKHTRNIMSMEETREWVVAYFAYDLGLGDLSDTKLWSQDYVLGLYGLSYDSIVSKFNDYNSNITIDNIAKVYSDAKEKIGYTGSILDWYSQSSEEFYKNVADMLYLAMEEENWQNVDRTYVDVLRERGYSIPDYVTYATEEELEAEEIERIKEELSSSGVSLLEEQEKKKEMENKEN